MHHSSKPITTLTLLFLMTTEPVQSHGVGSLGAEPLNWHTDQIARVIAQASSFGNLGMFAFGGASEVVDIDGRACLRGGAFSFDVRDDLIFDVDESIDVELEIERGPGPRTIIIAYDKNGGADGIASFDVSERGDSRFHTERVVLERARFAGRGDFDTDLMIWSPQGATICGINLVRSFETESPAGFGWLELSVRDEHGELTPARLGLYDASGRIPLPSSSALEVEEFDDRTRMVLLRPEPGSRTWPSANRWVFYTGGDYKTRLPAGNYDLVIARGIEYRVVREELAIEAGATQELVIGMERWADLPSEGWYSGDVHIHHAQQEGADGRAILAKARAEDLHIANSLQMANMGASHFLHRVWGPDGRTQHADYTVVPGQEDPRTGVRGHTIHLDIPRPVRNTERYLLYHETFEQVAELGGISGYAHIGGVGGALGGNVGLALEVPFGLVDFVEILQGGAIGTDLWFEFLNLGYRIAPAAGSDYPYVGHVGDVRTYVQLPDGYDPDAWFENLAAGRAFVTNGPILRLRLNDAGIGDQLSLSAGDTIEIEAQASLNPDIDALASLELIEQGEVVAEATSRQGTDTLDLAYETQAEQGTWFVIRATGRTTVGTQFMGQRQVQAVSAPIYVSVDGERTWKRDDVATIARRRIDDLDAFARIQAANAQGAEAWQDADILRTSWVRQLALLSSRIDAVKARYGELIQLAE